MHKSDHNIIKIASDHLSLAKETVIITMVCFMSTCCDSFWGIYYDVLKTPNDVTKRSGHVSRHVLITFYCVHNDLKKLRKNHHQEEAFCTCMSRSSQHAGKHYNLLCKELPKLFFNCTFSSLQKHVN